MTQPQPGERPDEVHAFLAEVHRIDVLYTYAWGYLQGVVSNYLQAISPAEVLRFEFEHLNKAVNEATERIAREGVRARQGMESAGGWLAGASSPPPPLTLADRFELMPEHPHNRP